MPSSLLGLGVLGLPRRSILTGAAAALLQIPEQVGRLRTTACTLPSPTRGFILVTVRLNNERVVIAHTAFVRPRSLTGRRQ